MKRLENKKRKNRLRGLKPKSEPVFSKNDNVIFIVCVIIAGVFWGLIKLSDFYTETYAFKVHYYNVPVDKQLTRLADSTLEVSIEARGYAVLKLNFFEDDNVIEIDLNKIEIIKNDGNKFLIYTQELKPILANLIKIEETNIELSETTLGFTLENLFEKQVNVIENHEITFKQQYDLYEPASITPTTVTVFGPKKIIDTLNFVYTEKLKLNDVESNKTISIGLTNPYPNLLHFEPNIVTMHLRVEKFTESSIETVIDFSAINEDIKSFPATVMVNFKIAQKDFNNVQSKQFHVVPELDGLDLKSADKVHLKLVRKPEFTRNEWVVPSDVEYLIIK